MGSLTSSIAAAVTAAALVVGAASCATPVPDQRELSDALVDAGIDREVADCTAKAIVGSLPEDDLRQLTERGPGGAPVDDPKRTDDPADRLREAMARCRDLQGG